MAVSALQRLIVGGTMLVPGVSGGSMAILLDVYDDLVRAVGSFFRHKRESLLLLIPFCLGGGIGIFLLAAPLLHLLERYPGPMLFFFAGAVAGSVPMVEGEVLAPAPFLARGGRAKNRANLSA